MNIGEEKLYIYSMMREITEERRKLTDMYYGLKERLDQLNRLETIGIDDLSLDGYVDLANKNRKQKVVSNVKRETDYLINKLTNVEKEEEKIEEEEVEETIIPRQEIDIAKRREIKSKPKFLSTDKVAGLIATVLKESGVPMHIKTLYNEVSKMSDLEITDHNFRKNLLPRAVQKNSHITRATKGYYQYKF